MYEEEFIEKSKQSETEPEFDDMLQNSLRNRSNIFV
jgi:hypothetical protein